MPAAAPVAGELRVEISRTAAAETKIARALVHPVSVTCFCLSSTTAAAAAIAVVAAAAAAAAAAATAVTDAAAFQY